MAAKKPNPAWDFLLAHLKDNRNATYGEVRDAAAKKKLTLHPIMFGRAQALLGYVKQAKRGMGKAARAKAAAAGAAAMPAKRGPGRPRKNPVAMSLDGSLDSIIAAVKGSEQAKARYSAALQKIQAIVAEAIG